MQLVRSASQGSGASGSAVSHITNLIHSFAHGAAVILPASLRVLTGDKQVEFATDPIGCLSQRLRHAVADVDPPAEVLTLCCSQRQVRQVPGLSPGIPRLARKD